MANNFREVKRIPVCLGSGTKYQVEIVGNEVVISEEVKPREWEDITHACHLEYRESQHCDGRYIAVIYVASRFHGTCLVPMWAAVIGTKGIVAQKGFKVEPAEGAYTSFKIFRKCSR